MSFMVAIDGPAGSGKSTIAKSVAKKLNFQHVDTGAMFRAVALYKLQNDIQGYDFLNKIDIVYKTGKIYLNGQDVSEEVRMPDVTSLVSTVAKEKAVRDKILEVERLSASLGDSILDGRDIGYKVLPNANLKIFLTADVKTRALRRFKDNKERGINIDLSIIEEDIKKRDFEDETRLESPLKMADDAILIDTSNMTIMEVEDKIISLIKERY